MKIDQNLLNIADDIKNAHAAKFIILEEMLEEGDISPEIAEKWHSHRALTLIKRSWWTRWKDMFNSNDDGYFYTVIRIK